MLGKKHITSCLSSTVRRAHKFESHLRVIGRKQAANDLGTLLDYKLSHPTPPPPNPTPNSTEDSELYIGLPTVRWTGYVQRLCVYGAVKPTKRHDAHIRI